MSHHECRFKVNGVEWAICGDCNGRIHMSGCTSKRNKHRDCCKERHRMLFDQGQVYSVYSPEHHILAAWEPKCIELKDKNTNPFAYSDAIAERCGKGGWWKMMREIEERELKAAE